MKYFTYLNLARQLKINMGLATALQSKALASINKPKDIDKA